MITGMNIHLEETTRVEVAPLGIRDAMVIRLDEDVRLFFQSEAHLRNFAENILKQLDAAGKVEKSA